MHFLYECVERAYRKDYHLSNRRSLGRLHAAPAMLRQRVVRGDPRGTRRQALQIHNRHNNAVILPMSLNQKSVTSRSAAESYVHLHRHLLPPLAYDICRFIMIDVHPILVLLCFLLFFRLSFLSTSLWLRPSRSCFLSRPEVPAAGRPVSQITYTNPLFALCLSRARDMGAAAFMRHERGDCK